MYLESKLVCCCGLLLLLFYGNFEQVASKKQQYLIRPPNLDCLKNHPIPEDCYRRGPFLFSAPRIGRRSSSDYLNNLDYNDLTADTDPDNILQRVHSNWPNSSPWAFFLITPNYLQQTDQQQQAISNNPDHD